MERCRGQLPGIEAGLGQVLPSQAAPLVRQEMSGEPEQPRLGLTARGVVGLGLLQGHKEGGRHDVGHFPRARLTPGDEGRHPAHSVPVEGGEGLAV